MNTPLHNTPPGVDAALAAAMKCLQEGRPSEAEKIYGTILLRHPDNRPALFNLGLLASRRAAPADAARLFKMVIALDPTDADATAALAVVNADLGLDSEARDMAARALTLRPGAPALAQLGTMYGEIGMMAEARQCLRDALQAQPENINALATLAAYDKLSPADPAFQTLARLSAEGGRRPPEERARIEFALAKAKVDQPDEKAGYENYALGNRIKKSTYPGFSIERMEEYFASLATLFDATLIAKFTAPPPNPGEKPVFIVGMQRSGSTLAAQILASHAGARTIGESPAAQLSLPAAPGARVSRNTLMTPVLVAQLSPEILEGIRKRYATGAGLAPDKNSIVVDKMLPNFMLLGLLKLAMPEAKFIHCQRDPADAGLSVWTTLFFEHTPWAYGQRDIARYYKAQMKLMAHWQRLFPEAIHVLHYERMVADQEGETRRLLEFCGLPWDAQCLDFHATPGLVKTASVMQVRQPMSAASVGKGRRAAVYLKEMLDELDRGNSA